MQDERVTRTVELFQQASMLASNLEDLRRRLPAADLPDRGPLPPEWNEFRSCADCVEVLFGYLRSGLGLVAQRLDIRHELSLREALLPPSAKFPRHPAAWLESVDPDVSGTSDEAGSS
jgi:hypothetical protein